MKLQPSVLASLSTGERADLALRAAAEDAIAEHVRSGVPLAVWRGNRVVELDAREILAERAAANRRLLR